MFIEKLTLHGFGKLQGTCRFSTSKCNILCQNNEFGKSTLVDSILYSFYNFPTSRVRRGELKPKEKYRPWFVKDDSPFQVKLEFLDEQRQRFRLLADFNRSQPFELTNLITGKAVPLEGMSFGRRFFRMPLQTFTQCFFLRQNDFADTSSDELIDIIEEAAVSNQKVEDSSIRKALNALGDCRVQMDDISAGPITLENLLRKIGEKLSEAAERLRRLELERDRCAKELLDAEALDGQISQLGQRRFELERDCLQAEILELQGLIQRQKQSETASQRREERLAELKNYEQFDPALQPRVQQLDAQLRLVRDRAQQLRATHEERLWPAIIQTEEQLAGFPQEILALESRDLDQLRSLQRAYEPTCKELAQQEAECERLRQELLGLGVAVDDYDRVRQRTGKLLAVEQGELFSFESERERVAQAIAEAQSRLEDAGRRAAAAKAQREHARTWQSAAVVVAILMLILAVTLPLMDFVAIGAMCAFLALVFGGIGFHYTSQTRLLTTSLIEPALAQEVSASSETKRLREQLENLETGLERAMQRLQLAPEDVKLFSRLSEHRHEIVRYYGARECAESLRKDLEELATDTGATLRKILPSFEGQDKLETKAFEQALTQAERCLGLREQLEKLKEEEERQLKELEETDRQLGETTQTLEKLLEPWARQEKDLDRRVSLFLEGCQQNVKLTVFAEQALHSEALPGGQLEQLSARQTQLRERLEQLVEQHPELRVAEGQDARACAGISRAELQEELEKVSRQREELRITRINAFNESDRAIDAWRREGPQVQAEIERLEALRAKITDFRDALKVAHRELSGISEEVFTQWAAALNERINRILPMLTPHYRDLELSDDLEISLFSTEVGRRLGSRELQHLSKGARDQLNLAVRIAISEYLSAHVGQLPFVFDEPFAHWDDKRFAQGMRFLAELASRHQVILLSCHHWRYEKLLRECPELESRLHFCTLDTTREAKEML